MNIDKHVSLNINIRGLNQSPTIAINERSKKLECEGHKIYRLGLGQSPFPVPSSVVRALKMHAHEKDYLPSRGLPELCKTVAEFHRRKDQLNVQPQNVLIGPGSKELMFLLQLVFYGEIILPTPCWVSYAPQAKILGKKVKLIHTSFENKWRVTPEQLEEFFKSEHDVYMPRIFVLTYPSNPDGGSYSVDELKKIAEIARKYEVILLSDEIYGQLHYRGEHVSVAKFYPEGTIVSSGLSKWCGAGGWRLGTFAFPSELSWLMDAMVSVASETYTSVSAPIQYAAIRAFKGGIKIERYLWHVRRILENLSKQCIEILKQRGIRVHSPVGGFYLFIDFTPVVDRLAKKGITNSAILCERLLQETGVAILPGVEFQRPVKELTARLAYVDFDGARVLAASETIPLDQKLPNKIIQTNCENVIEATKKIADWISKD